MNRKIRRLVFLAICVTGTAASQTLSVPKTFEVASVRRHQGSTFRAGPLAVSGNLVRLQGYTLFGLILDAYHVRDYQLAASGSQVKREDLSDVMFDVSAKVPGENGANLDDVRLMLQALLADRFKLRVHREFKEMPVYALVAAKSGAKLKQSAGEGDCSIKSGIAPDGQNVEEVFIACPIERLADRLTNIMGERPVLDSSGLPGTYDFHLVVAPAYKTRNRSDPADRSAALALRDLGLMLSPTRAKREIIVIDTFELPAGN